MQTAKIFKRQGGRGTGCGCIGQGRESELNQKGVGDGLGEDRERSGGAFDGAGEDPLPHGVEALDQNVHDLVVILLDVGSDPDSGFVDGDHGFVLFFL